ncbi:MAG: preprotein translocase subunit YajC [Nitrospirae bacterium]|nr:preprotein translocase subunit YajC [Nitrospirota bacterium]
MFTDIVYAMGQAPKDAGGGPAGGTDAFFSSFFPLILIFVIFYFLLIRPQSKKAKEHRTMLENLKKGDKIITSGGIYGVIDDIDPTTATIKIAENVKVKISRSSIAGLRTGE